METFTVLCHRCSATCAILQPEISSASTSAGAFNRSNSFLSQGRCKPTPTPPPIPFSMQQQPKHLPYFVPDTGNRPLLFAAAWATFGVRAWHSVAATRASENSEPSEGPSSSHFQKTNGVWNESSCPLLYLTCPRPPRQTYNLYLYIYLIIRFACRTWPALAPPTHHSQFQHIPFTCLPRELCIASIKLVAVAMLPHTQALED